jgi:hypothetical protein
LFRHPGSMCTRLGTSLSSRRANRKLPYVIEKYKEGGSCVTVRKKKLFIYPTRVTLATCYLQNLQCNDPYWNLFKICLSLAGFSSDSKTFLFRQVYSSGSICKLINKDKKLSYTAAREPLIKRVKLVSPGCNIGLHWKIQRRGVWCHCKKKTLFIYPKLVTLATCYLQNLRRNDPYWNLTSICHAFSSIFRSHSHCSDVLIAKGSTVACPYSMFLRYVSLAGFSSGSKFFLFRQVYRWGSICKLINKDNKLSYTAAREAINIHKLQ